MKFSIKKPPTFLLFILQDLCGSILVMLKKGKKKNHKENQNKYTDLAMNHILTYFKKRRF